jgi:hypothetical protein
MKSKHIIGQEDTQTQFRPSLLTLFRFIRPFSRMKNTKIQSNLSDYDSVILSLYVFIFRNIYRKLQYCLRPEVS